MKKIILNTCLFLIRLIFLPFVAILLAFGLCGIFVFICLYFLFDEDVQKVLRKLGEIFD